MLCKEQDSQAFAFFTYMDYYYIIVMHTAL